jgi:hypothetical protein
MPSTIKMNREKLVETMKTNLEQHIKTYNKAVQEYLLDLDDAMSKNARTTRKAIASAKESGKIENLWVDYKNLPQKPTSYEDQYVVKIAMFDNSADPTIELDEQEFKQYMLDQWGWKNQFAATTASYINKLS